jgi:glycine amidinotransferase
MNPTVWSTNEWDPLELVVVGRVEDALVPAWDVINRHTVLPGEWELFESLVEGEGPAYPAALIAQAHAEVEGLVDTLEQLGVVVLRPERPGPPAPICGPGWTVPHGFSVANPRDVLLVVGDQLIEAPMPDRGRHHEVLPYRPLLRQLAEAGARWVAAPRGALPDSLYAADWTPEVFAKTGRYALTEVEVAFDAADFVRCGRHLFGQRSHVTNAAGIRWLRRHLGPDYTVHELFNRSPHAIHIDTTFVPLAPGRALVNPVTLDRDRLPRILDDWELLEAPAPVYTPSNTLGVVSGWVNMNLLSVDPSRIIVEASQRPMIKALRDWGFEPIPLPFEHYYPFAGSFHCATLDLRRRPAR